MCATGLDCVQKLLNYRISTFQLLHHMEFTNIFKVKYENSIDSEHSNINCNNVDFDFFKHLGLNLTDFSSFPSSK